MNPVDPRRILLLSKRMRLLTDEELQNCHGQAMIYARRKLSITLSAEDVVSMVEEIKASRLKIEQLNKPNQHLAFAADDSHDLRKESYPDRPRNIYE